MTTGDNEDNTIIDINTKMLQKYHLIYQGDKSQNPTVWGQFVSKIVLTLFHIVVPENIHTSPTERISPNPSGKSS